VVVYTVSHLRVLHELPEATAVDRPGRRQTRPQETQHGRSQTSQGDCVSTVRVVEIQTVSTRVGRGQCVGLSWGLLHQEIAACVLRVLVYSLASQTNIVKVQLCQVAGLGHSTSPFLSPQMQQRDLGKR